MKRSRVLVLPGRGSLRVAFEKSYGASRASASSSTVFVATRYRRPWWTTSSPPRYSITAESPNRSSMLNESRTVWPSRTTSTGWMRDIRRIAWFTVAALSRTYWTHRPT